MSALWPMAITNRTTEAECEANSTKSRLMNGLKKHNTQDVRYRR